MGTRKYKFGPQVFGWDRDVVVSVEIGPMPKENHRARRLSFPFLTAIFSLISRITGVFTMKMGALLTSMKKRWM
jgi:hypothetical protein